MTRVGEGAAGALAVVGGVRVLAGLGAASHAASAVVTGIVATSAIEATRVATISWAIVLKVSNWTMVKLSLDASSSMANAVPT